MIKLEKDQEEKSFYQEMMEKSKNYTTNTINVAQDAIDNIKYSMRYSDFMKRKTVRVYMNGLKIEGVRKYFSEQGFNVTCEQFYCKNSNNSGNQYTRVTITW